MKQEHNISIMDKFQLKGNVALVTGGVFTIDGGYTAL